MTKMWTRFKSTFTSRPNEDRPISKSYTSTSTNANTNNRDQWNAIESQYPHVYEHMNTKPVYSPEHDQPTSKNLLHSNSYKRTRTFHPNMNRSYDFISLLKKLCGMIVSLWGLGIVKATHMRVIIFDVDGLGFVFVVFYWVDMERMRGGRFERRGNRVMSLEKKRKPYHLV